MRQKVFAMVSAKQSFMHGAAIVRFEPILTNAAFSMNA